MSCFLLDSQGYVNRAKAAGKASVQGTWLSSALALCLAATRADQLEEPACTAGVAVTAARAAPAFYLPGLRPQRAPRGPPDPLSGHR